LTDDSPRWPRHVRLGLALGVSSLLLGLLVIALAGGESAPVAARRALSSSTPLTRGPYLQSVTTNSIVIVWETDPAAVSRVNYGLTPALEMSVADPTPVSHHAVTLTDLVPYTRYHYQVASGGVPLGPASTFRTAAPATQPTFSFAVFGDTRTNHVAHQRVVSRIVDMAPDFALHTGDLVASGGDAAQWDRFFAIEEELLQQVPLFPVLGNHEGNHPHYFEAFHLPHNERWYAFDYGPVHFVGLQVDGFADWSPDSSQYEWLEHDLATSDARWKVVFFHLPPYSSGPHGDDGYVPALQETLPPLFARHGVNIVFNGHDHDYERSVVNGVTYVVAGAGGAPLYSRQNDNPHSVYFSSTYHAVSVTVEGEVLSAVSIRPDARTFDPFTLTQPADTAYRPVVGPGLYTFGAVGARIALVDPGATTGITATVVTTRPPAQSDVRFLPRVHTITAAGGLGRSDSVALRYTDGDLAASRVRFEEQLRLYRRVEPGHWQPVSSTVDSPANWITTTAVDPFSIWAIGIETEPLTIDVWLPPVLRSLPEDPN